MHTRFGLVLMMTHGCNLRCRYCYTGAKSNRPIGDEITRAAIGRAVRSISPGGTLELGFFGGEPLLEAERVTTSIELAQELTAEAGLALTVNMTTNGTVTTDAAWNVMTRPDMDLSISCDGLEEVHDLHRVTSNGRGTSQQVLDTIATLLPEKPDLQVVMVLRPDTVSEFPDGIEFLWTRGIRHVTPTLDLWAEWSRDDAARLSDALTRCADVWLAGLPDHSISWFDEKAAHLAGIPLTQTARCGFGDGEVAVAPSGNLYPCERLIGEDNFENPMRLPGHALDGDDFCFAAAPERSASACGDCAISAQCNTTCRCSNYIRTGDVRRPDGLLCLLDRVCHQETFRVLRDGQPVCASSSFLV